MKKSDIMEDANEELITSELINDSMSYDEYRAMIDVLLEKGEKTGPKQSKAMAEYTRQNVKQMQQLDKTVELNKSLQKKISSVENRWVWLVLTEGWCGDAAQNIPVIQKMAEASSNIETRFLLRDEHTEVMDQYLTNGGRSIPKLVCLDADILQEIGTWGPRPGNFQKKAMGWKDNPDISAEEWVEKLHAWYAKDKSQSIQSDFEQLIEDWE